MLSSMVHRGTLGLVLLGITAIYCVSDHSKCMEYEDLEESLFDPENMEELVPAFFPTDLPTSIIVDVTYVLHLFHI